MRTESRGASWFLNAHIKRPEALRPVGLLQYTSQRDTTPEHTMTPAHPIRYTSTAIALHWLLALAIIGAFSLGLYMADLPFSPQRVKLYNWHKWAGVTILALSAFRLLDRKSVV